MVLSPHLPLRTLIVFFIFCPLSLLGEVIHLKCTTNSEQNVVVPVEGPSYQFVLDWKEATSRSLDQYNPDHVKCKWTFQPHHGSKVLVRYLTADFPQTEHCAGSYLRIYNEASSSHTSGLNYPGYNTSCGLNFFPKEISSNGPLTMEFETTRPGDISYYVDMIGTLPTSCPPDETHWNDCPSGPCCQGDDCCVVELGTTPVDITSNNPFYYKKGAGDSGQNCSYQLRALHGSQIMVNFKEIDMVEKSPTMGCHQQAVTLKDEGPRKPYSLLDSSTSFCGQMMPNFPGPSVLTSSSNRLNIRYTTHNEKIQRGNGFKAAISAINPLCAELNFSVKYGSSSCDLECGVIPVTPAPTEGPAQCLDPVLKVKVSSAETGKPIANSLVKMTTHNPIEVTKIRDVTRKTASDGLVQDSRFIQEDIKITASAAGFDTFTKMINFTCEEDKCVNCVWFEQIELNKAEPNETTCTDASFKIKFTDSVSGKPIYGATFDIYRLPLHCPVPEEEVPTSSPAAAPTSAPASRPTSAPTDPPTSTPTVAPVSFLDRMISLFSPLKRDDKMQNAPTQGPALRPAFGRFRYVLDRSTSLSCNMTQVGDDLTTNEDGEVKLTVESSAYFLVRNMSHAYYLPPSPSPVASLNCSVLECSSCSLHMKANLTLPSCTTAALNVHVRENNTDEAIVGANVDVFLAGKKFNTDLLTTDENGRVELKVLDKGTYRVNVSADGFESLDQMASTSCDPKNCSACATLVKFKATPISKPQQCPDSTISVNVLDLAKNDTPANLAIDLVYHTGDSCNLNAFYKNHTYISQKDAGRYVVEDQLSALTLVSCQEKCRKHKGCFFISYSKLEQKCQLIGKPNGTFEYNSRQNLNFGPVYCPRGNDTAPSVCKHSTSDCLTSTLVIADGVDSLEDHVVNQNGMYTVSLSAPGYKPSHEKLEFNCTPGNCHNCSQVHALNMEQVFCEETHFEVAVTESGKPVSGAMVSLVKPAPESATVSTKETCSKGMASFPVGGSAKYAVKITKKGYEDYFKRLDVFCKLGIPCSDCKPMLEVNMVEVFCNKSVSLSVAATDHLGNNITEAQVKISVKKNKGGSVASGFTEISDLWRNTTEAWREGVTQFGTYTVEVAAPQFLPASTTVEVEEGTACEHRSVNVNITLQPKPEEFPCPKANISVLVQDKLVATTLPGARVVISYQGEELHDDVANNEGRVSLLIGANGNYKIEVSKDGYTPETSTVAIACSKTNCSVCSVERAFRLDQPRCKDVHFPVTVTDFHNHEKPISNAKVELIQLYTLAGESNQKLDTKYTNAEGVANFTVQITSNVKYLVKLSADGYIASDDELVLDCNHFQCGACNPVLKPQLKEQFCENKNLTLVISDALKNERVGGASITMWIDINSERDGEQTYTTNADGEAIIPLKANGKYNFEVSHSNYMTLGREFEIEVQPGLCDAYHPIELSPLSPVLPTPCEKGVRVSLGWAKEPADLDLYSYRVHNDDVKESCLTYFCDGKDPCSGITHDIDNKNGGLNGSETITYCNLEDFVHMIYVDEVTGRGSSLADSEAKLVFQSRHQSAEVRIKPSESLGRRYWLAGCLLLENGGFTFLEVNQFMSGQPSVDKPHFCFDEIQLRRKAVLAELEAQGELTIKVQAEELLARATVELRTPTGLSHYRSTDTNGTARFTVLQDGEYAVLVRSKGYYPVVERRLIKCSNGTVNCKQQSILQMVKIRADGALRLNLAWDADEFNSDLDLHTVQVDREQTTTHCETYYNQPNTCLGVKFGREGSGETITILNAQERPTLSYLIFIQDRSANPNLNMSQARLSISDGDMEKVHQMPVHRASPGDIYWFAGCVAVAGENFLFLEMDKFTRTNPKDSETLTCVGLLKGKESEALKPAFCSGVDLEVEVVDSYDNQLLDNSQLKVTRRDGEIEERIHVPKTSNIPGKTSIPIAANGIYHIQADHGNYTRGHAEISVECDLSRCSTCRPNVVIPLVGGLKVGQARLAVSWRNLKSDGDVDLYVVQRSVMLEGELCVAKNGPESANCTGVKHLVAAHGHGTNSQNRFESMELSGGQLHYYMVVVDLQPLSERDHGGKNNLPGQAVHVVITDSDGEEVRVEMDMSTFEKDRYWIVGCMGGEFMSSASFSSVNSFLENPPENEEDYCRSFLQTGLKNCFSRARGPSYSVADSTGVVGSVRHKATMKKCADNCTLTKECQAWVWDSADTTCLLYKDGRLSGKVTDLTTSYAGVCPKPTSSCGNITVSWDKGRKNVTFRAEHVLTKGQENWAAGDSRKPNYWLANDQESEQKFELDLGCERRIHGVTLVNTHAGLERNYGTKTFKLFCDGQKITERIQLPNPLKQDIVSEHNVLLNRPTNCKVLRFQAIDYWGDGPGLQYLAIIEDDSKDGNKGSL